jgi:hypothetical protein
MSLGIPILSIMIYRRKRRGGVPGGFFRFQGTQNRTVFGAGDGDFIRLRDEFGNEWRGVAERQSDETIRYRFRDSEGKFITGISERGYGILLRDEHGNTWRGFLD